MVADVRLQPQSQCLAESCAVTVLLSTGTRQQPQALGATGNSSGPSSDPRSHVCILTRPSGDPHALLDAETSLASRSTPAVSAKDCVGVGFSHVSSYPAGCFYSFLFLEDKDSTLVCTFASCLFKLRRVSTQAAAVKGSCHTSPQPSPLPSWDPMVAGMVPCPAGVNTLISGPRPHALRKCLSFVFLFSLMCWANR